MNNSNSNTSQDAKDKAKAAATAASEKVRTTAQDVAGTVASEAAGYADQAKETAASEVKSVASALRTAADEMRSGSPQERTFSQIADGLADASDAVRDKDLGEMVGSLNDFAKRNPIVFLGGAALIGFAATRFAKASGSSSGQFGMETRRPAYDSQLDRPTKVERNYAADTRGVQSPAVTRQTEGDFS